MREIKFRAWDKKNKEMLVPNGSGYFGSENHLNFVIDGNGKPIYLDNLNRPEDIVFMQYIGQKDKNGVEIYEGDIVDGTSGKAQIIWDSEVGVGFGFCWEAIEKFKNYNGKYEYNMMESITGWIDQYEIIGNIYETKIKFPLHYPDLLEGKA